MCDCIIRRLFYFILMIIFLAMLILEVIALGTFGAQFNSTREFWKKYIVKAGTDSMVCVLYGRSSIDGANPHLVNNASCGFSFWGIVTIIVCTLGMIIFQSIMGAFRTPIFSMFRIADLVISGIMVLLSLVISAVLTAGLKATCAGFGHSQQSSPCRRRVFISLDNQTSIETLQFYGKLSAAQGASWIVTIALSALVIMYIGLLTVTIWGKIKKNKKEKKRFYSRIEDVTEKDKIIRN